jgi:anthranilate phosphoribosyltransferase
MTITNTEALARVIDHREIFHDEMLALMRRIMSGEMTPVMIAAVSIGLRVKKETIGEIAAAAQVMREFALRVEVPDKTHLLDIVGTGGDGSHSFNISTASTFVAAAAGARVAKHGGRSVSSTSGSADVLEALGAFIGLKPEQVSQCLAETGIGFMFAPNHHASMKHAAPVRKELGVRTIFNILGPLTNPAGARAAAAGLRARDGGLWHQRHGRDLAVGRDDGRRAEERRGARVRRAPQRLRLAGVRLARAEGGQHGGVGAVHPARAGQRRRPGA